MNNICTDLNLSESIIVIKLYIRYPFIPTTRLHRNDFIIILVSERNSDGRKIKKIENGQTQNDR